MQVRRLISLCALSLVGACQGSTTDDVDDSAARIGLDGFWQSDGYGYALDLSGEALRFFHVTETTCVEADVAGDGLDDIFGTRRIETGNGDIMYLASDTEPLEYRFDRVARLPEPCDKPLPPTQKATLRTLIAYFETHYGFFAERGVEFSALRNELDLIANADLRESELFERLSESLAPLSDAHVELSATIDGKSFRYDADVGIVRTELERRAGQNDRSLREERENFLDDLWTEGVGRALLNGNGRSSGNGRIQYGVLSSHIGYLGIRSMGGFVESDGPQSESEVLDRALEDAISWFLKEEVRSVILDVSINSGGYEHIARQIAGRFTDKSIPAYSIHAVDENDKTPWQQYVVPADGERFLGPVYVFTSRETVSAAEALVLAMRARKRTFQVGEPTRGAISGKLAKLLPNQWAITLSNEVYLDHEGNAWEARGIPPDLRIPVFPDERLESRHKVALARLVAHVGSDSTPL